jgi:hypothetical protein
MPKKVAVCSGGVTRVSIVRLEAYWAVMNTAFENPISMKTRSGKVRNTGPFQSGAWAAGSNVQK